MNKIFVLLTSTFLLLSAQVVQAWTIEEFDLRADIQVDGSVNMTETIVANFSKTPDRHGIIRNIPIKYNVLDGASYKTPIINIKVEDELGTPRPFIKSKKGAELSLKIGDSKKLVRANETYVITYNVTGVLESFDTHDELYWNVTGNGWDTRINTAQAQVHLPVSGTGLRVSCFTGKIGSTAQNCKTIISENQQSSGYKTTKNLSRANGLTLVFGWDKGFVNIPEKQYLINWQQLARYAQWLFIFPFLFSLKNSWQSWSKVRVKKSVIPLYHPPQGLSLGVVAYLFNKTLRPRDLTAILIKLCVDKRLKIEEVPSQEQKTETDFKFTILKTNNKKLSAEALRVLEDLSINGKKEILLSELTKHKESIFNFHRFSKLQELVKQKVQPYKSVYSSHQEHKKMDFWTLFTGLIFVSFVCIALLVILMLSNSPIALILFIANGITFMYIPQYNLNGYIKKQEIEGFRKFIATAEKQKINWSEAQDIFETNLPYAIVFGLTDKWAQVFKNKIKMPEWYQGSNRMSAFKSLEHNLTKYSSRSISASTPKTIRSGSSGFSRGSSGGGRGGGGGSSW